MEPTDVLEPTEISAILRAADDDTAAGARNVALLRLMLQTGIRSAEARAVELSDIRSETWPNATHSSTVQVLRLRSSTTKGQRPRHPLPLHPDTIHAIDTWLGHRHRLRCFSTLIFCTTDPPRGRPLTGRYLRAITARIARRAGITRRVHPHLLRHTALTSLYDRTRDLRLVQDVAGHSSSRTTERYTHVHPAAIAAAMGCTPDTEGR